ncbi:MAG: hypothetical protein JW909_10265 [Planctomycetes bacterium]|nr:hypothetical protein [Planctomycetota bacterium]
MNHVDRFKAVMGFEPFDRLPMIEWAVWWDRTLERWYGEGLPRGSGDAGEIRESLGLDPYRQLWIWPRCRNCPSPERHGAGIVGNMDDYMAIREVLYPDPAVDGDLYRGWAEAHGRGEMVVWISLDGFFWFPRTLLGIEAHLYAFYDQAELMHTMNRDLAAFNVRAVEEFCEKVCVPEFMTFGEDMSYNNGPMLSRELFDEFLLPYYREVVPVLKRHGIIPMVDSDGDVTKLIPWLEDAGIEGLLPYERMAGVDVGAIRAAHPEWRMIGAFDKMVMKNGEDAMRKEFERLLPVMTQGGFIPSVDHQTPPDVPLENYRVYVRLLAEYCAKAAQ